MALGHPSSEERVLYARVLLGVQSACLPDTSDNWRSQVTAIVTIAPQVHDETRRADVFRGDVDADRNDGKRQIDAESAKPCAHGGATSHRPQPNETISHHGIAGYMHNADRQAWREVGIVIRTWLQDLLGVGGRAAPRS